MQDAEIGMARKLPSGPPPAFETHKFNQSKKGMSGIHEGGTERETSTLTLEPEPGQDRGC